MEASKGEFKMSIIDDYHDVKDSLDYYPEQDIFERFADWAFKLEEENDLLREKLKELEITVKNISKLLQR